MFRILYFNTRIYDFLTAALIEGFNALAGEQAVELVVRERSNYARRAQVWNRRRICQERDQFQLVILGTSDVADTELFWQVSHPDTRVCIDGSDYRDDAADPSRFVVYFKRELFADTSGSNVRPCPFAIERRWLLPLRSEPRYFLSACFGPRTGPRAQTLERLQQLPLQNAAIGEQPMSRLAKLRGIAMGQCTWPVFRRHQFGVGHNRRYYRILNNSLLSMSVPGEGHDTARWWEILGAGALIVSEPNPLMMPRPFEPMEHYLPFSSLDELKERLEWARLETRAVAAMRHRAREFSLAHHTSRARAQYVLDTFRDATR